MGKAPAVIVVARHGARLDAEDKTWISSAPAPYDPPLSYGGWTQTRALGARIASLLHARDISHAESDTNEKRRGSESAIATLPTTESASRDQHKKVKRRKNKIIIHSSPFLRCIQSSVAISAGVAQYEGNLVRFEAQDHQEQPTRTSRLFSPTRSKTLDTTAFESRYSPSQRSSAPHSPRSQSAAPIKSAFVKPILRVDAFLGEWLSPDYYDQIKPPPASSVMVAGAKAGLLRTSTPIHGAHVPDNPFRVASSSENNHNEDTEARKQSPFSMDQLTESLNEDDSSPVGPTNGQKDSRGNEMRRIRTEDGTNLEYQAPTPNYAISTSDAIPGGYVAHARDACIKIDDRWDSMTEPQNWGDGGEYGEEWSSMHRRFRKGLMDMITWYKKHDPSDNAAKSSKKSNGEEDEEAGEDGDIILVLVTHGAGCNALIGALTNQPVLLDVGMGSLTMAVRKDPTAPSSAPRPRTSSMSHRRRSSIDISQSDEYEMKVVASTEHLRAGADLLKIPQLQPPNTMPSIPEITRPRGKTVATSGGTSPVGEMEKPRSKNSSLGSIRRMRPIATTSFNRQFSGHEDAVSPTGSTGLWGSRRSSTHDGRRSSTMDIEVDPVNKHDTSTVDFARDGHAAVPDISGDQAVHKKVSALPSQAPADRRGSQLGLWGGGLGMPAADNQRRWTIDGGK